MFDEMEIGKNQIETIAFNIYKDIELYINSNQQEFIMWKFECDIENKLLEIVFSTEGILNKEASYQYEFCQY